MVSKQNMNKDILLCTLFSKHLTLNSIENYSNTFHTWNFKITEFVKFFQKNSATFINLLKTEFLYKKSNWENERKIKKDQTVSGRSYFSKKLILLKKNNFIENKVWTGSGHESSKKVMRLKV